MGEAAEDNEGVKVFQRIFMTSPEEKERIYYRDKMTEEWANFSDYNAL